MYLKCSVGVRPLKCAHRPRKYKDLAQKRTLADAFDLFLCDKRVGRPVFLMVIFDFLFAFLFFPRGGGVS